MITVAEWKEGQGPGISGAEGGLGSETDIGMRLLRQVCHDVRQELAVIQALVDLVAKQPALSSQSSRHLGQIAERASYTMEMMRNVVERTPSFTELNLAAFASEAVADVQLRTETSCRLQALPVRVVADPVMLRRAGLNMLDNAVRAAGPTGSVTVRVVTGDADARIEVAADGPGIGQATPGLVSLGLAVRRIENG